MACSISIKIMKRIPIYYNYNVLNLETWDTSFDNCIDINRINLFKPQLNQFIIFERINGINPLDLQKVDQPQF